LGPPSQIKQVEQALSCAYSRPIKWRASKPFLSASYRRGDLFEKRRRLMNAWGDFCSRPPVDKGKVSRFVKRDKINRRG
jgi:hypothetical protein